MKSQAIKTFLFYIFFISVPVSAEPEKSDGLSVEAPMKGSHAAATLAALLQNAVENCRPRAAYVDTVGRTPNQN